MPEMQVAVLEQTEKSKEEIRREKKRARWRRWRLRHLDERKAWAKNYFAKVYYPKNKDKIKKRSKDFYEENKEEILANDKRPEVRRKHQNQQNLRRAENPEPRRTSSKKYYSTHKKEFLQKTAKYQREHPEVHNKADRKWYRKNRTVALSAGRIRR